MTVHECRDRSRALGSYLDGELEASKLIDIDDHVGACDACREEVQLLRAMRGSLKRVVKTSTPVGFRERIGTALAADRARDDAQREAEATFGGFGAHPEAPGRAAWKSMVPLATAAAIALAWGAATRGAQVPTGEAHAGFGDDLLAELVAEHSQPLPPEATNLEEVRRLERWVGIPVQPKSFERGGAHLVGGRVVPWRLERAAMLQYVVGKGADERRVSVLVYDAQKIQVGTSNLAPRAVGTAEVRVGRERGYSVAATERGGEGFLVASDMNPDETAQLAAMVYDDR
jgi:anti-sigma factor RsiW